MNAEELADRIAPRFPETVVARNEATVTIDPSELVASLEYLRDEKDLAFDSLSDASATDWPGREPRFWLAYHLYSMTHRHRVRLTAGVPEERASIRSVTGMFPGANWLEREVFDFFGINFEGHPDLTRILMPDDWEGHPLRKDYGLGGVPTRYHGAFIPPVDERGG
ncbi:MAG: NADH-quinone oxidoreductase subunit C [Actinomycetota bacterium]